MKGGMTGGSLSVSRGKRGTTIKASGSAAQALFDRLAAEQDARDPNAPAKGPMTVEFTDFGQDFLEWDIGADGRVVASRGQAWVWVGLQVLGVPRAGEQLRYRSRETGEVHTIRYPLKAVRALSVAPSAAPGAPAAQTPATESP